jgi:hypothetical protein
MSDESTAPADVQDQPTDESTPQAPETSVEDKADEPDIDLFDERFDPAQLDDALRPAYKQMQGRFTQRMQELAEERREVEENKQLLEFLRSDDDEERALALQALGYDLDSDADAVADDLEDDYDEDYEDNELSGFKQKLAELEQWKQAQEQAFTENLQQQEAQQYEDAVNEFLDESWVELKKQIGRDDFSEEEELVLEQMAAANLDDDGLPDLGKAYTLLSDVLAANRGKWVKSKDAPEVSTAGSSATQVPDLDDPKQRREYMENRIAAIQASSAGHTGT